MPRVLTVLLCFAAVPAFAQRPARIPPPTTLVTPAIPGVLAAGTPIELVKGDFPRTEGPVAMPDGGIVFTGTDSLIRIDPAGAISTLVEHSNGANAVSFDRRGRLIAVERAANNEKVGVLYPPGQEATLADNYQGTRFNRLNDLVVTSTGAVYFSDTAGLYYLPAAGGAPVKVISDVKNPNGIILSPDEKTAYVNDKDGPFLLSYDVRPDGTLANRRNFATYASVTDKASKDPLLAEDNGADGMAMDNDGRVYVATNIGVEVFSPRGAYLGAIPAVWGGDQFMLRKPQNLAFSGPDKKTLFIVGSGAVFKVRMLAAGIASRAK